MNGSRIGKQFIILTIIFLSISAIGQERYYVFFTDKDGVSFDPYEYFDQKAIERRQRHGVSLDHYTDRPIREDYIEQVREVVDSIKMVTRWFNGVVCYATAEQINRAGKLEFVREVRAINSTVQVTAHGSLITEGKKRLLKAQIGRMEGMEFHEAGFTGKGVRIAIFDAGFPNVDVAREFLHIRARDGIVKTWDFVTNRENVYRKHRHGTMVLSNIAGVHDVAPIGLAIDAEFLLARVERILSESRAEEENWLAAAEWADKNGAQIINSSLGYTGRRYFRSDMNGDQSMVARAAEMAAGKGILVVNSAGNEGDNHWRTLGTPGDADSILTVGGINPWTNLHTQWSSYGPSADGRPKPNISAYGHTVVRSDRSIESVTGTSFSSPLIAGFAACAWQAYPDLTNMELIDRIEQSGDLYPYHDYAHGYGVPQASLFMNGEKRDNDPTFSLDLDSVSIRVVIDKEDFVPDDIVVLDYVNPFEEGYSYRLSEVGSLHTYDYQYNSNSSWPKTHRSRYLYVQFIDPTGFIQWYSVIGVHKREVFELKRDQLGNEKGKLRIFYRGYMKEFNVQ